MLTYRTPNSFHYRFARSKNEENNLYNVENWLLYHGKKLKNRFKLDAYVFMNHLLASVDITRSINSLEEVIGLKLELASKFGLRGKMYGLPIWYSLRTIVKDAVLKYTMSATRSKREAARFLGLHEQSLNILLRKHKVDSYFEETIDKES